MSNSKAKQPSQKKKTLLTCIYALIVGLLILACAVVIAMVSTKKGRTNQEVGPDETIDVSTQPTFVAPMQNASVIKDYSSTRLQYNSSLKQWEIHKAVDIFSDTDATVCAITDGVVTKVYNNHLEGGVVEISHANGLVSVYKSLDKSVLVKVGDNVSTATVLGEAANTMGLEVNSGAHLHLEIYLNGVKVDPNNYVSLGNK